jgi:hypothetical protein
LTASLALMGFPFVLGVDKGIQVRRKDTPPQEDERWSHLP